MRSGEALKGHLDLLLLAILESRPLHGLAVHEELCQRSNGLFDLSQGTIYPALHRLERAGLIMSGPRRAANGHVRRVYRLTRLGKQGLAERRHEWRTFSVTVSGILGP